MCLSTLTDQLLFRPDNTFHYRLLDIGNKFEKIGNKTANNKRKRKDELRDLIFIAAIIRSRAKAVIFSRSVFSRSAFSRSAFSRSVFSRSAVCGLRFRGLCFRDTRPGVTIENAGKQYVPGIFKGAR